MVWFVLTLLLALAAVIVLIAGFRQPRTVTVIPRGYGRSEEMQPNEVERLAKEGKGLPAAFNCGAPPSTVVPVK